jgi:hypothetical protein
VRRPLQLVVLALLAGCSGGDDAATFDAADGPGMVLQDADVGDAYALFDRGRQGRNDVILADIDPQRNGRVGGWKSRYRRLDTGRDPGTVVIESKVDVFDDSDGARRDFAAIREAIGRSYRVQDSRLRPLELGEETITATVDQGAGEFATRFYVVAWRDANAHAWVLVNGLEPLEFADAERLARAQAKRIDSRG